MRLLTHAAIVAIAATLASTAVVAVSDTASAPHRAPDLETCRLNADGTVVGPGADICAHVARRWSLLLDRPATPGVVVVQKRTGFNGSVTRTGWRLEVAAAERPMAAGSVRQQDGLARHVAAETAPHEAGHFLFASAHRAIHDAAKRDEYCSVLPDWIDEAVAIWMEGRGGRERRLRMVVGTTPSLDRLAQLANPYSVLTGYSERHIGFTFARRTVLPPCERCAWRADSLRSKFEVIDVGTNVRGRPDTIVWYANTSPSAPETFEALRFYELSHSLMRFIHERGGAPAVRELIARYSRDPRAGVSALAGLPKLPSTVREFEAAWHRFLEAPPPESH